MGINRVSNRNRVGVDLGMGDGARLGGVGAV